MTSFRVPDSYFFIVHLKLNCNVKCSYCIQNFDKDRKDYPRKCELSTQEWIDGLNKFSGKLITLSGGEVTMRPDIAEIINGIKNFDRVHLGTNLIIHPEQYLDKITQPNLEVGFSFHGEHMDATEAIRRMDLFRFKGYNVHVNIVNCEPNADTIASYFRSMGYTAQVNPYQGWNNGRIYPPQMQQASGQENTHNVKCKTSILAVSPDGNIYPCAHLAYIKSDVNWGNITTIEEFEFDKYIDCNEFGHCNPCVVGRIDVRPS